MDTATVITLRLAMLIGLALIAAGVGGVTRRARWREMFDEFDRSPGLVMAIAWIAFLFGLLVILVHNIWTDPLAIIISIIGWAGFVEGLLLMAMPNRFLALVRPLLAYERAWGLFSMILGLLLVIAGVTGRATLYI